MRDPIILLVHLIATLARLMGPGGLRSVVAESVLVKQQLLILNRSRHRAPNLCASDRILAGVCALFMRPARVIRSATVWVSNSEFGRSIEAWDTIAWRLSSDLRCLAHEGSPAPPASPGRHSREALQTRRRASRHR